MPTKILSTRLLPKEVQELKQEVHSLRSLLISWIGKDEEGQYQPAFVERMIAAAHDDPTHQFKNATSFLRELKKV